MGQLVPHTQIDRMRSDSEVELFQMRRSNLNDMDVVFLVVVLAVLL